MGFWEKTLKENYAGLTDKERASLEELDRKFLLAYAGAQSRLMTGNPGYLKSIIDPERDSLMGMLDGMEFVLDSQRFMTSTNYQNMMETLINIWDGIVTEFINQTIERLEKLERVYGA